VFANEPNVRGRIESGDHGVSEYERIKHAMNVVMAVPAAAYGSVGVESRGHGTRWAVAASTGNAATMPWIASSSTI